MSDLDWMFDDTPPPASDAPDLETPRGLKRPITHYRKAARREFRAALAKEALNQVVPSLPDRDTVLYVLSNGSGAEIRHGIDPLKFSFGDFLPVVCSYLGDRDIRAYVATWTMARAHALTMIEMLTDGRLASLTFFCDPYFRKRESAICSEFVLGLQRFGERGRFLAFKTHAKIIALAAPDGNTCVIMGSPNLSQQPRVENFTVDTDPGVFDWLVRDYFEAMFNEQTEGD